MRIYELLEVLPREYVTLKKQERHIGGNLETIELYNGYLDNIPLKLAFWEITGSLNDPGDDINEASTVLYVQNKPITLQAEPHYIFCK